MNNDKDVKVEMKIVSKILTKETSGRRLAPRQPKGTILYCIEYVGYDGFFTYSYIDKADAEKTIEQLKLEEVDNLQYLPFNIVKDFNNTKPIPKRIK